MYRATPANLYQVKSRVILRVDLMIKSIEILKAAIASASDDPKAVALLRSVLRRSADHAPIDALIELCDTLITIRQRDALRSLGRN